MDFSKCNTEISFQTDLVHGRTLVTKTFNQGWVEFFKKTGRVWVASSPTKETRAKWRQHSINAIGNQLQDKPTVEGLIGLISHLALIRSKESFKMPLFGIVDQLGCTQVTAGNTRIIAATINNVSDQTEMIIYSTGDETPGGFDVITELTSTQEFEDRYQLTDIDYRITTTVDDSGHYCITSSTLRHTIYDRANIEQIHANATVDCLMFWNRAFDDIGRIKLEIQCTESDAKKIQPSANFDVTYIYHKPEDWVWSYGKILGAHRRESYDDRPEMKLSLWLFDITEPVTLEFLIPWADKEYSTFYSENQKSVLIDTSHVTSMEIIGNWVK
jgi:hypothetical protein